MAELAEQPSYEPPAGVRLRVTLPTEKTSSSVSIKQDEGHSDKRISRELASPSHDTVMTGFQRFKQALGFNQNLACMDLKNEVIRLMFSNDKEPVVVSIDEARFIMLMSAFTVYEKQAKPDGSHSNVTDVLRKLKQHMNECFTKDIPLYLILTYRLHTTYSLYDCDELKSFITGCIDHFEGLDPKEMTTAVFAFLEKDDFKVSFPISDGDTSIFFLLKNACMELARVSYGIYHPIEDIRKVQDHQGIENTFSQGFVYSRMLWTSLTLKLHDKRRSSVLRSPTVTRSTAMMLSTAVTRSTANLWQENLVKYSSRIVLDLNSIRDIKRGLEVGRLLKLSSDMSFNYLRMTDLLISGKTVRPLSYIETYFCAVESYIPHDTHLVDFLSTTRENFDLWIRDRGSGKVATASVEGTLLATIREGIKFVDCMNDVCSHRRVDPILVESESIKWVLLLLHLVDFTSNKADTYIKLFIFSSSKVLKEPKCKQEIKKYIRDTTRASFPRLTIQQFGALFKALKIYSMSNVEEFLGLYVVQQDVLINDPTWHSFISEVVLQFDGARNHFFFLDFFKSVANSYLVDKHQKGFILDLLQLKVPKLFAIEEGADKATEKEDLEVGRKFSLFLKNYIRRNALEQSILTQMISILGSISEKENYFQQLIVAVLKREVIPEFKVLQGLETAVSQNFQLVLQGTVSTLCKDLTWIKAPTTKQKFCWGLVASCCSKINITRDKLDWVHSYDKVLKQVGYIFSVYCSGRKLTESQCVIIERFPEEISTHPSEDVRSYYQWVREIQTILKELQDRIVHRKANYDEILLYASNLTHLHSLGIILCVSSLVCDSHDLHQMKTQFLQDFESLNVSIIKYIPDHPDVKWCTLPALLQQYGVSLPRRLQEMISRYVLFPGDEKPLHWEQPANPVPPSTTGQFQPSHKFCLQLSRNVSLYQLMQLIAELRTFQQPLIDYLEMLVFFNLHKSVMFDKYLQVQIRHNTEKLDLPIPIPSLTSMIPSAQGERGEEEGLPIKVFIQSLECTRNLLLKVTEGDAKYSEIIAEGALDLENMDLKREVSILFKFTNINRLVCTGLTGVYRILELFEYFNHISNIDNVCTQYKLKGCLRDPRLKKLKELVDELASSEDARARLTPNEASQKMQQVKAILGFTETTTSKTLHLFAAIRDSAVFYEFVRDKKFYGDIGINKFNQQYELITDQLQYEVYDEQILNHLFAAFKLMTPFMDHRQDLERLMSKVLALDVTNCINQLETVNANITLICLWFSRVEDVVDSLKKENKELLNMKHKLEDEVKMLLEKTCDLDLEKQSLIEVSQALKDDIQVVTKNKAELLHDNRSLQEENSLLHQQISTLQSENHDLCLVQQESAAFGIEPWKVSRDQVKVVKVIGGGGWGAVSEGKLRVAVKQFYPTILSASNVGRLKREMEMLARIRHPNLVQFIGVVFEEHVNVTENPPYIITELLDISLRAAYESKRILPKNMCSIFIDTAQALDYLHRRHEPIIHRDVSSANVLLKHLPSGGWIAKVSDLGSANLAREAFTMNEGAIIYCAPEAFTGGCVTHSHDSLTPKVDIYSYGIMLCELATSTLPEQGVFPSMLDRVLWEWPKLHHLITICIRKEPEKRPSMEKVLSFLQQLT